MNVEIKVIPHKKQRYETCGDYWEDEDGTLQIRVSYMRDVRFEQLVAHHEHHEAIICRLRGIAFADIDAFDTAFEAAREGGRWDTWLAPCGCKHKADDEPGDDKHAPYYEAHQSATFVERQLAAMLCVDWEEYEKEISSL